MLIENWIAWLLSVLLSLAGVPCVVENSTIYVPSLEHRFVVTLSCIDLVGIGLWTFIFVFTVWVYANLNNSSISCRKYAFFGVLGFSIFFFANIFRMFIEIFYVANVGASYISYILQWQAFEEQVGIGIMFMTFTILLLGFHLMLGRQKPHSAVIVNGKY